MNKNIFCLYQLIYNVSQSNQYDLIVQNSRLMKNDNYTNSRAFQFQFDLEIQKIKLLGQITIPKSSYLQVIWRRGQKNISTKIKPQVKGTQQQIFFGETLSMISTCALNTDTNEFSLKQSIISAVIYISGSQKLFGSVTINLSSVLNPNYMERGVKYFQQQLNGRAKSKICMKLTSNYLKEMVKGDQMSIGSGVNSNSYQNTSSYSIDRRTIQIPSKDTYSVLSYGGAVRYSNRKDQSSSLRRQDSSKKIQEQATKQYGRYGYTQTQTNFYSKVTNQYNLLQTPNPSSTSSSTSPFPSLSNPTTTATTIPTSSSSSNQLPMSTTNPSSYQLPSSNIKSISSIQSSASRPHPSTNTRISQPIDPSTRSTLPEQNSRLLIQQQTKRSKLQSENNKQKLQNQEIKNKLAEYIKQNMRIKDQLKKYSDNNDSRQAQIKKQNQQMKEKNYILVSQVRELKNKFDRYVKMENQFNYLRNDKQALSKQNKMLQQNLYALRKQMQETKLNLSRTRQSQNKLNSQLQSVRYAKQQSQQSKNRQKDLETKIRQLNTQVDYYQNNSKNLSNLLREAQEKARVIQRDLRNAQAKIDVERESKRQSQKRNGDVVAMKEKQIRDLTDRLNSKGQQCTKYILQAQKYKSQYGKAKDDKISQLQQQKLKITSELQKQSSILRDVSARLESTQQQKSTLSSQLRNQQLLRSAQQQKQKQTQQSLNIQLQKSIKQSNDLKKSLQQLQTQNVQLNRLLSQKNRSALQTQAQKQQLQSLMKQNLQLQLQLKYKCQQISRYQHIAHQNDNYKYKIDILQGNVKELNQLCQKIQKQVKEKNRAYLLQCEKSKMYSDQRTNISRSYGQLKDQLDRAREMISNGEKQFQDMRLHIEDIQNQNVSLIQDIRKMQDKLKSANPDKLSQQIKSLQCRNRELQSRDIQKIKSIQSLHRSLATSSKQIKQLQQLSQHRYQQMQSKQHLIHALQDKISQLQQIKVGMNQQLNNSTNQKSSLIKKNQMIMEELYNYKKKFQEEKQRSKVHSTVHVRSTQEYIKVRNLENQLQKRDQKIRKMEKQMIVLENQNVNLSIQVMKKLEDITPK